MLHLLDKGLKVTAVDAEREALDVVQKRVPEGTVVELICSRFEDFQPASYDVVVAGFSLFFLPPADFNEFWGKIVASIEPGGLFAGQFLGVHDDWVERGYSAHTSAQVRGLLVEFEILHFEEAERDGETALKTPKHWHVFHVVARKHA